MAAAQLQWIEWHDFPLLVEGLQCAPTGSKVEGDTLTPDKQTKRANSIIIVNVQLQFLLILQICIISYPPL